MTRRARSKPPKFIYDGKTTQVYAGKPYTIKPDDDGSFVDLEQCCDCALVHLVKYRVVDGKLEVTVWMDEKETIRARKKRDVMASLYSGSR